MAARLTPLAENDPVKLVAAAIVTYVSGLPMYVYHSKAGIRGHDELADMPGAKAFAHLRKIVPGDLASWTPKNARWPDSPFRMYARDRDGGLVADRARTDVPGGTGAVRVYAAVKGGEFFAVPLGVEGGVILGPRRRAAFEVVDPMTGDVLARKTLEAGERFELAGRELFVLRGRVR